MSAPAVASAAPARVVVQVTDARPPTCPRCTAGVMVVAGLWPHVGQRTASTVWYDCPKCPARWGVRL